MSGNGTEQSPFEVATAADLRKVGSGEDGWDLDCHYLQTADIDLSGYDNWVPIGAVTSEEEMDNVFVGVYDGGGCPISGLTINSAIYMGSGLFGVVVGAVLKNITVINANITVGAGGAGCIAGVAVNMTSIINCKCSGELQGSQNIGGLCGMLMGTISNCFAEVDVGVVDGDYSRDYSPQYIGGLIGQAINSEVTNSSGSGFINGQGGLCVGGLVGGVSVDSAISNCHATGDINGWIDVGGLVGTTRECVVRNCFATGNVTGEISYTERSANVGGLLGVSGNLLEVYDSYATGDVEGEESVGGLAGYHLGEIHNCFSTGCVIGDTEVGGLIGERIAEPPVEDSFWDTETSGQTASAGGVGKSTSEMKDIETFTNADWNICAIEDFDPDDPTTWFIDDGNDYPRLGYEWDEEEEPEAPKVLATQIDGKIRLVWEKPEVEEMWNE